MKAAERHVHDQSPLTPARPPDLGVLQRILLVEQGLVLQELLGPLALLSVGVGAMFVCALRRWYLKPGSGLHKASRRPNSKLKVES